MSELITGKEALIALANGEEVEYFDEKLNEWVYMDMTHHFNRKFRLKPRTIRLNGIELPAPFEPEEGEEYWYITDCEHGYGKTKNRAGYRVGIAAWRTEDEIKQVLEVLRGVFNVK